MTNLSTKEALWTLDLYGTHHIPRRSVLCCLRARANHLQDGQREHLFTTVVSHHKRMDPIGTNLTFHRSNPENNMNTLDPLMEQMRNVLRLDPRVSDSSQRRERRFSDADRPPSEFPTIGPEAIAVRSRDDSRWLPAPDDQSHRYGLSGSTTVSEPEELPSQPLEQHICSSAMCAVAKVFETTELLELVLSFLETRDVFSLRLTSRLWNSTIHQSPQLRLHFFTCGQWSRPGSRFQLLPLHVHGLTIELGQEIHLGQWFTVSFTTEAARRVAPDPKPNRRVRSRSIFEGLRGGLGSRTQKANDSWPASKATPTINSTLQYEDLFVIQPPVLGMQAFVILAKEIADESGATEDLAMATEPRPCAKLWCDAGITLGFLAETAQSLLASQKAGPSNAEDAIVVFKAIMSFCAPEQSPKKRTNTRSVTRL